MPLIVLLVTFGTATFQTVQAQPTKYDGVWITQFKGVTWARLELRTVNGQMTGGISLGNIEMNKDGTLRHAGPAPQRLSPIFDVRQQGAVVSFARKDSEDTDRFEIELKGAECELRFVLTEEFRKELADEGLPAPKPVRLARSK